MGDFNAKMMRARNELEREVIGPHALYDEESEQRMGKDTKDKRDRIIKFCTKNGLQIKSTYFEKKAEEKATYRPIEVGRKEKTTVRTRDQIDYVIVRTKDKAQIMDCKSDCKAKLETSHYPLLATIQVQLTKVKKGSKATLEDDNKSVT